MDTQPLSCSSSLTGAVRPNACDGVPSPVGQHTSADRVVSELCRSMEAWYMAQLQRDAPTGGAAERPAAADPGALLDAVNAAQRGTGELPAVAWATTRR